MKRLIVATSLFAIVAAPAFAVETSPPFEQLTIDRALPVLPQRAPVTQPAERSNLSGTRPNVGVADAKVAAASPWSRDYNFIAPAL